jgi:hypothetical protein
MSLTLSEIGVGILLNAQPGSLEVLYHTKELVPFIHNRYTLIRKAVQLECKIDNKCFSRRPGRQSSIAGVTSPMLAPTALNSKDTPQSSASFSRRPVQGRRARRLTSRVRDLFLGCCVRGKGARPSSSAPGRIEFPAALLRLG